MTDRKIVFERREIHNPQRASIPPLEGWRYEFKDEDPKPRARKCYAKFDEGWQPTFKESRPLGLTCIVDIQEDD